MERAQETGPGAPRLSFPRAVSAGVLAIVTALLAGHIVAALLDPGASPLFAFGGSVVDLMPARPTGQVSRPELLVGTLIALVIVAALAGLFSRRTPVPGVVVALALGVLGVAAVLTRPDTHLAGVLAPLAGMVVEVDLFVWLRTVKVQTIVDRLIR